MQKGSLRKSRRIPKGKFVTVNSWKSRIPDAPGAGPGGMKMNTYAPEGIANTVKRKLKNETQTRRSPNKSHVTFRGCKVNLWNFQDLLLFELLAAEKRWAH